MWIFYNLAKNVSIFTITMFWKKINKVYHLLLQTSMKLGAWFSINVKISLHPTLYSSFQSKLQL